MIVLIFIHLLLCIATECDDEEDEEKNLAKGTVFLLGITTQPDDSKNFVLHLVVLKEAKRYDRSVDVEKVQKKTLLIDPNLFYLMIRTRIPYEERD